MGQEGVGMDYESQSLKGQRAWDLGVRGQRVLDIGEQRAGLGLGGQVTYLYIHAKCSWSANGL